MKWSQWLPLPLPHIYVYAADNTHPHGYPTVVNSHAHGYSAAFPIYRDLGALQRNHVHSESPAIRVTSQLMGVVKSVHGVHV